MGNRGLVMVSVVSGLIAVVIFFMVIAAYAGGGGGSAGTSTARATTGQPVDAVQAYGAPDTSSATLAPGPTVAPVQQQAQSGSSQQAVEAPAASAPPNPFTAGIK